VGGGGRRWRDRRRAPRLLKQRRGTRPCSYRSHHAHHPAPSAGWNGEGVKLSESGSVAYGSGTIGLSPLDRGPGLYQRWRPAGRSRIARGVPIGSLGLAATGRSPPCCLGDFESFRPLQRRRPGRSSRHGLKRRRFRPDRRGPTGAPRSGRYLLDRPSPKARLVGGPSRYRRGPDPAPRPLPPRTERNSAALGGDGWRRHRRRPEPDPQPGPGPGAPGGVTGGRRKGWGPWI